MVSRSRLVQVASTAAVVLSLGLMGATSRADSIAISNPSFQNGSANYPGYATISGWTANNGYSGVNGPGQPFGANTNFPDANQVGFLQNSPTTGSALTTISQNISGLTPGDQYWFQAFYNGRQGSGTPGLLATYGSQTIANVSNISTSNPNYTFLNTTFTPTSSSGTLTIENSGSTATDNTLLIDSVSVIQRDPGQVVIANPSFEGSTNETWIYPGYIPNIGGWAGTGNTGVNTASGPFADNGTVPDGSQVGFLQNNNTTTAAASLSQTLTGLTVGTTYQLKFFYNARTGAGVTAGSGNPILDVSLGGTMLPGSGQTVAPVAAAGAAGSYDTFTGDYTATSTSALLDVSNAASFGTNAADSTLLVDNFSLAPLTSIPEPASLALLGVGATGLLLRKRRKLA